MGGRYKSKAGRKAKPRWAIVVLFDDGEEVVLRSFTYWEDASRFMTRYKPVDWYPKRTHKVKIQLREEVVNDE